MAQYLKEEVRRRIEVAALRAFARKGYQDTTMAEIAEEAGVATGNIYRYHDGKIALFRAVVPESFVERFRSLLRSRVEAARGEADVDELPPSHAHSLAAGRMLDFSIENRLRVVTLLGGSRGTPYEGIREEVIEELVDAALRHARSLEVEPRGNAEAGPKAESGAGRDGGLERGVHVSEPVRFDLEEIYRNFVGSLVRILERFEDPTDIREATEAYTRYHLGGLGRLLA